MHNVVMFETDFIKKLCFSVCSSKILIERKKKGGVNTAYIKEKKKERIYIYTRW